MIHAPKYIQIDLLNIDYVLDFKYNVIYRANQIAIFIFYRISDANSYMCKSIKNKSSCQKLAHDSS